MDANVLMHLFQGPLYRGTAPAEGSPSFTDSLGFPIDHSRPVVQHPDGGPATEYSMTVPANEVGQGTGWSNIPSIWNGEFVTDDQAVMEALSRAQNGYKFPTFDTIETAIEEAIARSHFIGQARGMK